MGAQWKREVVQDHKFDFINVDDFVDNSCWLQFRYLLVFAAIIRGILVYCSDIFTAANLLANSNENSFVPRTGVQLELFGKLPFEVYKYLFSGCILLGFLLLGFEIRRARAIIVSRDISYAFTSLIANRYYVVKSYPHFCFFSQINNSKKMVDDVAFFCFFTFRNWKRLMLADAPRQVINATILYQTFRTHPFNFEKDGVFDWNAVVGPEDSLLLKKISLGAMIFTVFMFIISLLQLIAAVILYIPLVSHIQGNLKEYCCHKIDKRIDELIRKNIKTRATDETKTDDYKQPTLPNIDLSAPPVPTAPRTPAPAPRTPAHVPRTPAAPTPRTPYQNAQNPYYPQTPKSNYSNIAPQYQSQPPPPLPQQQQQQQKQGGHDYYSSQPAQSKHVDPYAESSFTSDKYYTNDQRKPNQSGYGYNNPYPQAAGGGGVGANYSGSSNTKRTSPSYNNNPASRARRYDEYGQPRPASPNHSHHGSDLDSHHSSQPSYGYGIPRASSGSSVGLYNNNNNSNSNSNIAQNYGNPRQPRNGAAVFEGEYQTPPPRRQDNSYNHGGNRGY